MEEHSSGVSKKYGSNRSNARPLIWSFVLTLMALVASQVMRLHQHQAASDLADDLADDLAIENGGNNHDGKADVAGAVRAADRGILRFFGRGFDGPVERCRRSSI
jgi:hypothetical protein